MQGLIMWFHLNESRKSVTYKSTPTDFTLFECFYFVPICKMEAIMSSFRVVEMIK